LSAASLDTIERSLPNGFHDAELLGLHLDYGNQTADLELRLDVGSPDVPDEDGTDSYRPAHLKFSGVQFVVMDAPGERCDPGTVSLIDVGAGQPRTAPCALPALEEGVFLCWVFMIRTSNFLRIAARDVAIKWVDGAKS
jgi:hypothetical protein